MKNGLNKYWALIELIESERSDADEYFTNYLNNYNSIITHDCGLLFRLVKKSELNQNNLYEGETDGEPDTIIIDYFVGSITDIKPYVTIVPYGIDYIAWIHNDTMKIAPLARFFN